jgi:hypothetical protein
MGVALLALGVILFFTNLDELAATVSPSLAPSTHSFGGLLELGLAGLRAAQTYFFDHAKFQSDLYGILVSFWPLILMILGGVLLQNAVGGRLASSGTGLRSQATGVRE